MGLHREDRIDVQPINLLPFPFATSCTKVLPTDLQTLLLYFTCGYDAHVIHTPQVRALSAAMNNVPGKTVLQITYVRKTMEMMLT